MADLKKVYVAPNVGDAHVLRGLLETAGIQAVVRGDDLMPLQGGTLLHMETRSSIWVLEDEHFEQAVEIVEDYLRRRQEPAAPSDEVRRCSGCGEDLEPQFTECWSCGRPLA